MGTQKFVFKQTIMHNNILSSNSAPQTNIVVQIDEKK